MIRKAYRNWKLSFDPKRPATGTWVAERFGVTLSGNSEEMVKRMVDNRAVDYPWEVGPR